MKRRGFVRAALLAALLAFTVAAAMAQQGQRRGPRLTQGGIDLLTYPAVQQELKMTPEQTGKVLSKQGEVRQSVMDAFQSGGNFFEMSTADRQKLMAKVQGIQSKAVGEILDKDQQKRFRQLELQQIGPNALSRADVQADLKLTDAQKKQQIAILSQADADRMALFQGVDLQGMTDDDRQKMMAKMQDVNRKTGDRLLAILTDDQKKQWTDLQGAPFKFPADALPPAPAKPAAGAP